MPCASITPSQLPLEPSATKEADTEPSDTIPRRSLSDTTQEAVNALLVQAALPVARPMDGPATPPPSPPEGAPSEAVGERQATVDYDAVTELPQAEELRVESLSRAASVAPSPRAQQTSDDVASSSGGKIIRSPISSELPADDDPSVAVETLDAYSVEQAGI